MFDSECNVLDTCIHLELVLDLLTCYFQETVTMAYQWLQGIFEFRFGDDYQKTCQVSAFKASYFTKVFQFHSFSISNFMPAPSVVAAECET